MSKKPKIRIISGSSHPTMAQNIADNLKLKLVKSNTSKYGNSESFVEINESIRGDDVFIIQSFAEPINDSLMELLIMIHASKIASAHRVIAVIPCYPYARQDRKEKGRAPITAKLVANMLSIAGADHIITMDLHSAQIQGFFNISVDNLYAQPTKIKWIKNNLDWENSVIVAPHNGSIKRAISVAETLKVDFAIVHKVQRLNEANTLGLIGEVKDKIAIIIDDIADSCETVCKASEKLLSSGAIRVFALITHGMFSGKAISRVNASPIQNIIVTNTINQVNNMAKCPKIKLMDISDVVAQAVLRMHISKGVAHLFENELEPLSSE